MELNPFRDALFVFCNKKRDKLKVPSFDWCPSHLSFLDVVEGRGPSGLDPMWVLGNGWADFFAKKGAEDIALSKGFCEFVQHAFSEARMMIRYLSWALGRLFQQQLWGDDQAQ